MGDSPARVLKLSEASHMSNDHLHHAAAAIAASIIASRPYPASEEAGATLYFDCLKALTDEDRKRDPDGGPK